MSSNNQHKAKIRLARRLRNERERRENVGIFDTQAWLSRREARTGITGGRPARIVDLSSFIGASDKERKQPWWKRAANALKSDGGARGGRTTATDTIDITKRTRAQKTV